MGNACSSASSDNDVAVRTRQKTAPLPPNTAACDVDQRKRRSTTGSTPLPQAHHAQLHGHPHAHPQLHHASNRLKTDEESGGGERCTGDDRLKDQLKTEDLDGDLGGDAVFYSSLAESVGPAEEAGEDEECEEDEEPTRVAAVVRLVALLKMSALSMASLAGAFYLTRKFAGHDLEMVETAPTFSGDMSSVDSQMLPATFEAGCISCSSKSIGTRSKVVQGAANRATIKARNTLHDSYLSEYMSDFTPPRIYHNWWAAGKFPNSYYSNSPTIKDFRFRRIFGW